MLADIESKKFLKIGWLYCKLQVTDNQLKSLRQFSIPGELTVDKLP